MNTVEDIAVENDIIDLDDEDDEEENEDLNNACFMNIAFEEFIDHYQRQDWYICCCLANF